MGKLTDSLSTLVDTTRNIQEDPGKGDLTFSHNLYNVVGKTLIQGLASGRLNPSNLERNLRDRLSANLGVDLGGGYGASLGYNEYIGDRRQDLKLKITKDF